MPVSVRNRICLVSGLLLLSLGLSLPLRPESARAEAPKKNVQVKTLDDNREVLRPIPSVLKPVQIQAKTQVQTQAKPEVKAADSKLARQETKSETKTDAKSGPKAAAKTDAKTADTKTANTKTTDIKTGVTKTADTKSGDAKTAVNPDAKGTSTKKSAPARKRVASGEAHFVPPPPPVTPTMMGDGSEYAFFSGLPVEMMSKEALKDRVKEISIQYKDACRELEDHTTAKQEKIQRAQDFAGLYKEGVVSRRELETSQREASEVNSDIDRLTFKVKELKGLLDRINKRLAPTAAKKSGRKLIN